MLENVLNNTTNATMIPTIIAQKALGRLGAYMNMAKTVSRDSELTTSTQGTTIRVPVRGAVSANDKVAGAVYTKQNPTATDVAVVLNKHKEVTFTIHDVTRVVENQDSLMGYAEDGAIALAEAIEGALVALHPSVTGTKTWNASDVDSSMLAARAYFSDQKVPVLEQRYMSIPTKHYNQLLATDKFSRYDARGDGKAISDANVLRTYGFEIRENQLLEYTGSPATWHGFAYTRNGIVLATRPLPRPEGFGGNYAVINDPNTGVAMRTLFWYNADLGAHQLTMDVLFGVAVLDNRRVCELEMV